jgi:hypothetical protein
MLIDKGGELNTQMLTPSQAQGDQEQGNYLVGSCTSVQYLL